MNANTQAYHQYKRSTVETVAPEKLLIMLFNGALKNLNQAKKYIAENSTDQAHHEIMRAEEIIVELMSTLNMDYEISGRLFALYEYLYHRLVQANAKKDPAILDEVEGFLLEMRDTWQGAIKTLKDNPRRNGDMNVAAAAVPGAAADLNIKNSAPPMANVPPVKPSLPLSGTAPLKSINITG